MDAPSNLKSIIDALTYKIEQVRDKHGNFNTVETIRNYRMVSPKIIAIPQGRVDLIPEGYEIVDKRTVVEVDFPAPIHPLFPEQEVVYNETDDSCFINALVGWGKTLTALHIARKLGQKTLVITHTAILRDQWAEEVEKLFGFRPGIIGSGSFDISTPIVIANVQTATKLVDKIAKEFGTVIMDEAHHTPATTFTNIVDNMHCRYRIALSGTMKRKDGKHILFKDIFGPIVHKPPQNNTLNPTVKVIKTGIKLLPGAPWVKKINHLLEDYDYQHFIAGLAEAQAAKGHKVLIIADRVAFLNKVAQIIGSQAIAVTGETDNRGEIFERIKTPELNIIAGSRHIFAEGVSVNCLSCVILAIPLSSITLVEQIVGRVMRLYPGKLHPEVLDLHFSGPSEKKQNNLRLAFYMEKDWDIVGV